MGMRHLGSHSRETACCRRLSFEINFHSFPPAWQTASGEGVKIFLISKTVSAEQLNAVRRYAPASEVTAADPDQLAKSTIAGKSVYVFLEPLGEKSIPVVEKVVPAMVQKNSLPLISAYYGGVSNGRDYTDWKAFLRRISAAGAIIVGPHGWEYEIGNLRFWTGIEVDCFALHEGLSSWEYFKSTRDIGPTPERRPFACGGGDRAHEINEFERRGAEDQTADPGARARLLYAKYASARSGGGKSRGMAAFRSRAEKRRR